MLPGDSPPTQPRTAPRPQPHQGGFYRLPDDVGAVCHGVCPHLQCAVPAPRPLHCMETGQGMQATCTRRRQPTASLLRTATRPEPHQGGLCSLTLQAPCVSTLPVHCCTRPTNPPLHGHRAEYAGYPHRDEAAHFQHATGCTTPSTAPGWPPCRRHVCPHFLRAVMSCPRPHRAMDTGKDIQATRTRRRQPTISQSQATRRLS